MGARMVWEASRGEAQAPHTSDPTRGWQLLLLSVATSVDALAVGLSLAMLGTAIARPAVVIGLVAAALTAAGMLLGRRIGVLWGRRVGVAGGPILVAVGLKIVVEHRLRFE